MLFITPFERYYCFFFFDITPPADYVFDAAIRPFDALPLLPCPCRCHAVFFDAFSAFEFLPPAMRGAAIRHMLSMSPPLRFRRHAPMPALFAAIAVDIRPADDD